MQRHPFDIVSFLFGMFFLGAAGFAVVVGDELPGFDGRWIWPVMIILAGVVVLGTTLTRRSSEGDPADSSDPAPGSSPID